VHYICSVNVFSLRPCSRALLPPRHDDCTRGRMGFIDEPTNLPTLPSISSKRGHDPANARATTTIPRRLAPPRLPRYSLPAPAPPGVAHASTPTSLCGFVPRTPAQSADTLGESGSIAAGRVRRHGGGRDEGGTGGGPLRLKNGHISPPRHPAVLRADAARASAVWWTACPPRQRFRASAR